MNITIQELKSILKDSIDVQRTQMDKLIDKDSIKFARQSGKYIVYKSIYDIIINNTQCDNNNNLNKKNIFDNVGVVKNNNKSMRHPKCKGYVTLDVGWGSDFECGYDTIIDCDKCKYNNRGGGKNPEAKCNTPK